VLTEGADSSGPPACYRAPSVGLRLPTPPRGEGW